MMEILQHTFIISHVIFIVLITLPCKGGRLQTAKVEVLSQDIEEMQRQNSVTLNREKSRGKKVRFGGTLSFVKLQDSFLVDNTTIGCRKRRMRKFIGNKERNCTSLKPLKFVVCCGRCVPEDRVHRYFVSLQRLKLKTENRYRCSPHTFKFKKLRVFCGDDGSVTRYRIKVVESCKCKEYKDQQNDLQTPAEKIAERLRKLMIPRNGPST